MVLAVLDKGFIKFKEVIGEKKESGNYNSFDAQRVILQNAVADADVRGVVRKVFRQDLLTADFLSILTLFSSERQFFNSTTASFHGC